MKKSKILKNIKTGVESSDVATVEQTLVYDKKVNKFLFNNNYFDLNNALVADDSQLSGFPRMNGGAYLPVNYIFKDGDYMIGANGNRFIVVDYKRGQMFQSSDEVLKIKRE